jgi:hypothetical protein
MNYRNRILFSSVTIGALAGALVVFSLAAQDASADGTGSPAACLDSSNPSSAPTGGAEHVVGTIAAPGNYNAGAGNVVVYVCLFTGTAHSGPLTAAGQYDADFNTPPDDGACYEVTGLGGQNVLVTVVDEACPLVHFDAGVQLGDRRVRIIKVTSGGGLPQNFTGTISGHSPSAWTAAGGAAPGGGTPTDIEGVSTLAHTVVEDPPPAGWTFNGYKVLTGIQPDCGADSGYGGTRTAGAVIPAEFNNYTVCIRNTFNPSRTVRIIKVAVGGGLPQNFSGTISDHSPGTWTAAGGPSPAGGTPTDIGGVSFASHLVVEGVPPAGWVFDGYFVLEGLHANCGGAGTYAGARTSGAVIPANSTNYTVCIRNVFQPARTVRIIKVTDGGGLPQTFTGTISDHTFPFWSVSGGPAPIGGTATDITGVSFGSHVVTESEPPPGWAFVGYSLLSGIQANCLGTSLYTGTRTAGVVIPADSNSYTVCIRNTYQPGRTVRIIKVTSGGGLPQSFSGTISDYAPGTWTAPGGIFPAGGTPVDLVGLSFGSHVVIEAGPPAGWEFGGYYVLSGIHSSCVNAGTYAGTRTSGAVIPADGNNYTVCIRNHFVGTRTIRIIKVTSGGGLPQSFSGTISDHSPSTWVAQGGPGPNGGSPTEITGVSSGIHVITEAAPPAGWDFGGYYVLSGLQPNCSLAGVYAGSRTAGVTIPADGASYTVCIRNVYLATPTPTPTATPTAPRPPTATPTATPTRVAPGPPGTGLGSTGDAEPGSFPLWIVGALMMLAAATVALATGAGRVYAGRTAGRGAQSVESTYGSAVAESPTMPRTNAVPPMADTAREPAEPRPPALAPMARADEAPAPDPARTSGPAWRSILAAAGAVAVAVSLTVALLRKAGR